MALIPYVGTDPYACVACISLSAAFNGAVSLTGYQNAQDLAPNYAATVYSIINCVATTTGFLSPLVVAYFTRDSVSICRLVVGHKSTISLNGLLNCAMRGSLFQNTITEWSKVFWVGACMYITPSIIFMLFGSAETQPWNECKSVTTAKADEMNSMEQIKHKIEADR